MKINFPLPQLLEATFLKRYKRFFADVALSKNESRFSKTSTAQSAVTSEKAATQQMTLHVPNSGSMKTCIWPDNPCLVSLHGDSKKKLPGTLHFIFGGKSWIGVDTSFPNKVVPYLIQQKAFQDFKSRFEKFDQLATEIKINEHSRLDLVLWNSKDHPDLALNAKPDRELFKKSPKKAKFHFIEIKNVSMAEDRMALFPDSVTERGQKHLIELMNLIDLGHSAEIVFFIQRDDVDKFSPAQQIDPEYARLLKLAKEKGVIITPLVCSIQKNESEYFFNLKAEPLPISWLTS
jgi:sugar fermentation stimulation protein A